MASADPAPASSRSGDTSQELARSWQQLTRAATIVALLTSPALFIWFTKQNGWRWWVALLVTAAIVVVFRGIADLLFHRVIPRPSLFGLESQSLREEDVVSRRRAWFWRFWFRLGVIFVLIVTIVWVFRGGSWFAALGKILSGIGGILQSPTLWTQAVFVFFLFFANFAIMFGPILMMNLSQIQSFEPGDAKWGVKLDDVRGQAEAKEEVRRVVSIWQSGEQFERAGGKRERGLLFLGAPGTGKTMLAKAIATGFNSPFISIPGSGFAATFIGVDAIIVRILARRAKKLARKWGGQCLVFIDEIDAVGMRRQALQGGSPIGSGYSNFDPSDHLFFGPNGALTSSGDLVLETRAWRDRLFEERAPVTVGLNGFQARVLGILNFMFPGGMGMGGGLALNQLLVVMDGIDNPPFFRKVFTNKTNTLLDAIFVIPRRIGGVSLRIPAARPRREQIYFIGATNVPIERLDPALTRPGRMGRHVWFRTPTKQDRLDVLDLYIGKVSHSVDLDRDERREEIARVTNGYSPAMIEQVTSMALTIAHHSGRQAFVWADLVEAMTTLEAGTAVGVEYIPTETRAVAVHEAGHAACGHAYLEGVESTRLSIRMRGGSLGHHQALEKEERFGRFQGELFARLVWTLGAMAAERVFYGENSAGVGGDVASATAQASGMVAAAAMGPNPFEVTPRDGESAEDTRSRILERFEKIGLQIMNRTGGGPFDGNPLASALQDPAKRSLAAQLLGQAYVAAHNLIVHNRQGVENVAVTLAERREMFGDELLELLDTQKFAIPETDLADDASWPPLEFSALVGRRSGPANQRNGAVEIKDLER